MFENQFVTPPPPAHRRRRFRRAPHLSRLHLTAGAALLQAAFAPAAWSADFVFNESHPVQWINIAASSVALVQNSESNTVRLEIYDGLSLTTKNIVQAVYSADADAVGNTVEISDSAQRTWFTGNKIYGVGVENASARENVLTVSGGCYEMNASHEGIFGASVRSGGALNNKVVVKGDAAVNGAVRGASVWRPTSAVSGNSVEIQSGTFTRTSGVAYMGIAGAFIESSNSAYEVRSNTVRISGGNFVGYEISAADLTRDAQASENIVYIAGGTFDGATLYGVKQSSGETSGNGVVISGGTFTGSRTNVYASSANTGEAENPDFIRIIGTNRDLDLQNVRFYGNSRTMGNARLILEDCRGMRLGALSRFDEMVFVNTEWQTSEAAVVLTSDAGIRSVRIDPNRGFYVEEGASIAINDRMTLVEANYGFGADFSLSSDENSTLYTQAGVARQLSGKLEHRDLQNGSEAVDFVVTAVELSDQAILVAENRSVSVAFLNEGGDAALKALEVPDELHGFTTFAAAEGAATESDVEDSLKINGWHFAAGVHGAQRGADGSSLRAALYFEAGRGNYRTENGFNAETFRGSGDLSYRGGGIALRYMTPSGFYLDGSLRAGELKTEMDRAVRASDGSLLGYSLRSFYWGGHAGAGRQVENSRYRFDLYGRFYWSEVSGEDVKLENDRFEFDDVASLRTRIGFRGESRATGLYAGCAAEYEFDGSSRMTAAGLRAPEESLRGLSALGEFGWKWDPEEGPWMLDLNVTGWGGERTGVTGRIFGAYRF